MSNGKKDYDFQLVVGIDSGATLDNFERDIAGVIKDFNARKHEVQIGFDLKSTQELRKLIDDTEKKAKDAGKKIGDSLGSSSNSGKVKKTISDLTKARDIVKEYHKLMGVVDKNKSKFSSTSDGKRWTTQDKELKGVAKRINQITKQYEALSMTINSKGKIKDAKLPDLNKADIERLEYLITLQKEKLKVDNGLRASKTHDKGERVITDRAIAAEKKYQEARKESVKLSDSIYMRSNGVWASKKGHAEDFTARVREINQAKKEVQLYREEIKNLSEDEQQRYKQAAEASKRVADIEIEKIQADRKSKSQAQQENLTAKSEKDLTDRAIAAEKKYQEARKIAAKYSDSIYMRKNGVWASRKGHGGDFTEQVKNLNLITKEYRELALAIQNVSKAEQQRYKEAITKSNSSANADIEAINRARKEKDSIAEANAEKSLVDKAITATNNYHKALRDNYKDIISGNITFGDDGIWKAGSEDFSKQSQRLNEITTDYQELRVAIENVSQAERERYSESAKISERDSAAILEKTNRQLKEEAELLEKNKAETLLKSKNRYMQMIGNSKNWSAAGGITSSKDVRNAYSNYKELTNQIGSLIQSFESGEISAEGFSNQFDNLSNKAKDAEVKIQSSGKGFKSMTDKLGASFKKMVTWLGATQILMGAVRTAKDMARAAIDIESSMAQLQIVTNATDNQMENFLTKSTSLAKDLGKSITEVLGSVETFSRLGYNLEDASGLAKYANILSNVANVDVSTATTGLTSIIKGYGMDVDNSEHVADVLVEVGQKYAISAEELMAAFQRGGAALAASGTDFEKSAALFAATNASLQNAESVGTMWKTKFLLSLRIEMCA